MTQPKNWMPLEDEEEELLLKVKYRKRRKLDILNKSKISKNELDEVFNG